MDFDMDFDTAFIKVTDSIKQLLYHKHENIFERLDFEQDSIYEEPLLYTYVSQEDDKWLDCIIYGYEKKKKKKIDVFSNSNGVIYLPNIGYFKTNYPNSTIRLETLQVNTINLKIDGREIEYDYEPILLLSGGIELITHQHPLLETVFNSLEIKENQIFVENVFKPHIENFNKAFEIIKECNFTHFQLLQKNLKKVLLYQAKQPHSFAVMTAHNMVFLNVSNCDNEMFFVDHICHEGAHLILNTMTYESKYDLFKVPYNLSFSDVTGRPWEHSTLYLRFHGLFTLSEITKCLEACLYNERLSAKNIHEAKGRFVFNFNRFKIAVDTFDELDIFREEGLKWYTKFKEHYYRLLKTYEVLKVNYDIERQPYDFQSKIFERDNPF